MPKKQFFTYDSSQGALCAGWPADPVSGNGWKFNTTTQTCDWRVDQVSYRGCPGCSALNLSTCECDMHWLTSWERVRQVPGSYFCQIYTPDFATMTSECAAVDPGNYCRDVDGNVVSCTSAAARWRFEPPTPAAPSNINLAGQFGGCVQSFSYGNYGGSFVGWNATHTWSRFLCPSGLVNSGLPATAAGNYQAFQLRGVDAGGNAAGYGSGIFRMLSPTMSHRIAGQSGYYTIQSYGGPSGVVATTEYGCYWDPGDPLNWSGLATNVLGGAQFYPDGTCKGVVNSPACTSGSAFYSSYPGLSGTYSGPVCVSESEAYVANLWTSSCRGPYGILYTAYGFSAPSGFAGITVQLYNDALPEGVASTRTVETSGTPRTGSPSLGCRSSGVLDLLYIRYNPAAGDPYQLRYVYSRDGGRTWGPLKTGGGSFNALTDATATAASGTVTLTPVQLATGYQRVVHHLDEKTGRLVLLLWRDDAWYVRVATDEGNDNWSVSSEQLITAGDPSEASLHPGREGGLTFVFWDLSGVAVHLHCRDLTSDGTGTWE